MKVRQILPFAVLFLVASTSSLFANSASSTVNVQTNVNGSNSVTTSSDCKTKIRTEVNGVVKEVESEECGSVRVESTNEGSKVEINNKSITGTNPTAKVTPRLTLTVTPKPTNPALDKKDILEQKAKKEIAEMKEEQRSFFTKLEEYLKDIFNNLWPF